MSECEPLSRPTWVLGVQGGAVLMPEIVSQIHRFFIVNSLNSLSLTTEMTDSTAAGLSRIPQLPG